MKRLFTSLAAVILIIGFTNAFGTGNEKTDQPGKAGKQEIDMELQKKADLFLDRYEAELEKLFKAAVGIYWQAALTGKEEEFNAYAAAELEYNKLHSDRQSLEKIEELLARADQLQPLTVRALQVAELAFKGNQLPANLLEEMSKKAAQIEEIFTNFRAKLDGKEYSNNQLTQMLKKETDTTRRQKIWEALKQVGEVVGPQVVELARIRNKAARQLGYKNYWEMQIRLQEHDPEEIISIFAGLEKMTDDLFKQTKTRLDRELAPRFKIKPEDMMPWHYDNPFFQAPPPSDRVNTDDFYENKSKEDIVEIARTFFRDIGLPIDKIIERSDIYEREGKQQSAFTQSMDRKGDTRVFLNITPNAYWMITTLHEMGHAVYTDNIDPGLPFNLREAAHTFTTEAAAKLFGALAQDPGWLVTYAGAEKDRVKELEPAILEQERRRRLIFARFTLLMMNFEKALYENPEQDLNTLWWDMKERYQMVKRPAKRNAADWAAKIHFSTAPVYYHNYLLGDMLAAQLRAVLVKLAKHRGPINTLNYANKEFGNFFKEKVFKPGMSLPWPEFVREATGEPLTAKYFADELKY
jgi:peptidyl-dipeptidase A